MAQTPTRRSPFAPVLPSLVAAASYAVAAAVWVVAGNGLPGGRWLAVHLFTLGVMTNVIPAFTMHFATTLTRQPNPVRRPWWVLVLNVGVVAALVGRAVGNRAAVAIGATVVSGVVVWSWWLLRGGRKAAIGARFGWVVRMYERAHGAFVHGVVLGALMGTATISGPWYGPAKLAHLHVNLLGWGGLTLLATLVFFGPTVARTRIVAGADERAAVVLRRGATALTVAVVALLATGVGGAAATMYRLLAAAGLALFATGVTRVCVDVVAAARGARPTFGRAAVIAVGVWFPVIAWLDVAMVATGEWRYLDALGLAMLAGVLLQSVLLAVGHVAPMLRSGSRVGRDVVLGRMDAMVPVRVLLHNLGVLLVVVAAATRSPAGSLLARLGWGGVVVAVVAVVTAVVLPVREGIEAVLAREDRHNTGGGHA